MDFCETCGTKLVVRYQKDQASRLCPKCGFTETIEREAVLSETVEKERGAEPITVIDIEAGKIRTLPTTEIDCPKCGNEEAFWWTVQTRGADESPTQFFRCSKCGYVWREYS